MGTGKNNFERLLGYKVCEISPVDDEKYLQHSVETHYYNTHKPTVTVTNLNFSHKTKLYE